MVSWAAHWEWGDLSSGAARISSFEVTDRIILDLLARYPSHFREVLVVGIRRPPVYQRYAVLSWVEDRAHSGSKPIKFSYMISNPSSYLYFYYRRASAAGRIEVRRRLPSRSARTTTLMGTASRSPMPMPSRRVRQRSRPGFCGATSTSSATMTTMKMIPVSTPLAPPRCGAPSASSGRATTGTTFSASSAAAR